MPPPRLKRSNTANSAPASLEDGEIAINQADGKLYYRTTAGGVSTFLTSAHKASHATGGSDALSAADIGALTQATADSRYVNVTGDTMTGGLVINAGTPLSVTGGRTFFAADSEPYGMGVKYVSTGGAVYFGATDGTATPGAQISKAGGAALMSFTNAGAASIPGTLTVGGSAVVVTTDSRLSDSRTPTSHNHAATDIVSGTLSDARLSANVVLITDARLSDARTPTAHAHGNITTAGAIGSTAGLPIITTTSGVLATGAFGTAAGSFCQGNDARLSDSRTPLAHTQTASTITDFATEAAKYGPVTSVNGLTGAVSISSSGGSITDGNKGDITVSGSGATWTINANAVITADIAGSAVTYAKIQNVSATDRLLGRSTAGAGVVEEITCTAFGRSVIAGVDASAVRSTLNAVSKGGDTITGGLVINAAAPLTVSGGRSFLAADSEPYGLGVRYVSTGGSVYFGATDGTSTPGAQISKAGGGALMSWTNAGAASIPGTLSVGGNAVVVTTDSRLTDARTPLAHNQAASTITDFATEAAKYGPVTSVNGQTGAVTVSAGSAVSDGNKGDITVSGSGATWTINANAVITADLAASAVTYAKIQNVSATDRLLGRSTAGAGVVEEIACTAFGRSVIAGANAAAVRATINAVSNAGGTISGAVTVTGAITGQTGLNISGGRSLCRSDDSRYGVGSAYGIGGGYVYFGAASAHSAPDAVISSAGGVRLMTLQNDGNVGIGTSSPSHKLEVNGAVRATEGIVLGASGGDALNRYEKGSWSVIFLNGFAGAPTYDGNVGSYVRIGDMVFASMTIRATAATFLSDEVGVSVSLPFTPASDITSAAFASPGGGFATYSDGAFLSTAAGGPLLRIAPDIARACLYLPNGNEFTASSFRAGPWSVGFTLIYQAS